MNKLKIEYVPIGSIKKYERNAKLHPVEQVEQIKKSIEEFGFNDPIAVWHGTIVEGHGRLMAAEQIGMTVVPVIRLDELTDEQRRAYMLVHNKTTMNSDFNIDLLDIELGDLTDFDDMFYGFGEKATWFDERERFDDSRQEGNEEYNEFLDKFEIPKTTDDCYTPDIVYDAVADWVANEYGVKRENFVRPFYPGGDYERYKYPKRGIAVDNPPFSILSEILKYYAEKGIRYFLFAPALTLFSSSSSEPCAIVTGVSILYENGASVSTSFVTNLEGDRLRTAPSLYKAVADAVDIIAKETHVELPKYSYPDCVITAANLGYLSKYGEEFRVGREHSYHIRALDAQKEKGKAIYGSGYLISEQDAAKKVTADAKAKEKAAATRWVLSERERAIIKSLK